MKLRRIIKIVTIGVTTLFAACKNTDDASVWKDESKVNVATTTTMITDMAIRIGGDKADVLPLVKYNEDPHGWVITDTGTKAFNTADLVLYNGLHLEAKIQKGLEERAKKGANIVVVTSGIKKSDLLTTEGETDPHVWGNPQVWIQTIDTTLAGFIKADPSNKDYFTKNAEDYKKEILAVDTWAEQRIQEIPADKRLLVTAHDAFQYFSKRYKLEEAALQGVSTADEAGLKATQELIDLIKAKGIKTIFAESTTNDKGIAKVAKEANVSVNETELYADACGKPGEIQEANGEKYDVGTYIGMIKHNVNTIVDALK